MILNDQQLTQIQETGELNLYAFGEEKINLGQLAASLDVLGIDMIQVGITPTGTALQLTVNPS